MKVSPTQLDRCTLNTTRRLTRAMSHLYDAALSSVELKSTQFSLLATLRYQGELPLSQLAKALLMERTTLTRNLKPLIARGLVESKTEQDKRIKIIALTQQGDALLSKAEPLWKTAQMSVVDRFGRDRWEKLVIEMAALSDLTQNS